MNVILHLDPKNPSKLLGVWAGPRYDGERPRCFYPDTPEGAVARAVGQQVVDAWPEVRPRADWIRWGRHLSRRTPYAAWWESIEVDDDGDLEALFVVASAEVLASAAAIHGTSEQGWTAKMMSKADELTLAGDWAGLVAHEYGGPVERYVAEKQLSSRFTFRADRATLLVGLVKENAKPGDADLALAYGLAHAGDRDLWIVLPEQLAAPTLERAAFIETKVRIFTVGENGITEEVIPTRTSVLAGPTEPLVTETLVLGDRARWIAPLAAWADSTLDRAHRRSYPAWHCEGRLVLRVKRIHGGLEIAAGVQYSKPTVDQPPPVIEPITRPLTALQMHRLVAAAARAASDRLDGIDTGHAEHRLQALLEARHLGLRKPLHREFPARRPPARRAYIDFLGVSRSGDLHIIETKIGPDEMLVLQGLDYWIWAHRHLDQLIPYLELNAKPRIRIDFVVAPDGNGQTLGPYSAAQAEALDGSITWRFHTATGWQDGDLHVDSSTRSRTVPTDAPRVHEPRWSVRLGRHLAQPEHLAGKTLGAGVFWPQPVDGLVPEAVTVYEKLAAVGLDHRMIGHVRSSQAFALNLFAPLTDDAIRAIWRRLGVGTVVDVEAPDFEWSDPDDLLGESTAHSPHRTQVDVLLRGTTDGGQRVAALIEVKLSETDFGVCSAQASALNPHPEVCATSAPFGAAPELCFQLANKDGANRRRYDEFLPGIPAASDGAGCPFRFANQPMRNVALARSLVARLATDHVFVAVCAPEGHDAIWRRWHSARAALEGVDNVYLCDLPASAVLQYNQDDAADMPAARYQLDRRSRSKLIARAAAQAKLDQLFPDGAAYEHVDARGNTTSSLLFSRPIVSDVGDDWVEITSPDGAYPLPLTFRVPAAALDSSQRSGRRVELTLRPSDAEGT